MRNRINWKYFVLDIFIILAVCLCSGIDQMEGRTVSVIEVLLFQYEAIRKRITWLDAFSVVMYGNLYLALPLISAISTMPLLCDELRSGNYVFHVSRVGIKRYVNQRYLSALVGSYANLAIGFLLFVLFLYCGFPSVHDFGNSSVIGLVEQSQFQMLLGVGRYALYMLCWSGMLAMLSCNLVSITQNIYVVLSVPFLINYVCASYLLETHIFIFLGITLLLYMLGYRMWIWKYQGVRA